MTTSLSGFTATSWPRSRAKSCKLLASGSLARARRANSVATVAKLRIAVAPMLPNEVTVDRGRTPQLSSSDPWRRHPLPRGTCGPLKRLRRKKQTLTSLPTHRKGPRAFPLPKLALPRSLPNTSTGQHLRHGNREIAQTANPWRTRKRDPGVPVPVAKMVSGSPASVQRRTCRRRSRLAEHARRQPRRDPRLQALPSRVAPKLALEATAPAPDRQLDQERSSLRVTRRGSPTLISRILDFRLTSNYFPL